MDAKASTSVVPHRTRLAETGRVLLSATFWSVLVAATAVAAVVAWIRFFDPDEFQHTHIAWSILQGLAPYRDFFEHHGPLYSHLVALAWQVGNLPNHLETLRLFRLANVAGMLVLLWVTYRLAREALGSEPAARVAVLFLATNTLFLDKAIEVRPDTLEALAWTAGLLIWARSVRRGKAPPAWTLCLAWTVMLLFNFKSGLMLVLFLATAWHRWPEHRTRIGRLVLQLALTTTATIAALLVAYGPVSLLDTIAMEILMAPDHVVQYAVVPYRKFPLVSWVPVLNWLGFAIAAWGTWIAFRSPDRTRRWFALFTTLAVATTVLGSHPQWYLQFYPLMAGVVGLGAVALWNRHRGFQVALACLFLAHLWTGARTFVERPSNDSQIAREQKVQSMTRPDEKVAMIWNNQGGWVFRPHAQYYWFLNENQRDLAVMLDGEDPLGEPFRSMLARREASVLVLTPEEIGMLPAPTAAELAARYRQTDDPAIWIPAPP